MKYGNAAQHVDSLNAMALSSDKIHPKHPKALQPPQPQHFHILALFVSTYVAERPVKPLKPKGLERCWLAVTAVCQLSPFAWFNTAVLTGSAICK